MGASAAISNAVADALAPLGVAAGRQPFTARPARGGAPRRSPLTVDATDLCFTPAVELAELIRRRALSPVEITRAVLERIERLNATPRRLRPGPRRASPRTRPARPSRR